MVFEQLGGKSQRIRRSDGAVGPDFNVELVVIGDLAQARSFHGVIHLAHRRVHGINGNEAQAKVVFKVLVGRDVTAAALETHFHIKLAAFGDGGDVDILVEHFHVAIGFDHARSNNAGLVSLQVDGLGAIAGELEGNLLQVEDDVGGVFHHAGNGLELMQHAFNLHRGHGCAFN